MNPAPSKTPSSPLRAAPRASAGRSVLLGALLALLLAAFVTLAAGLSWVHNEIPSVMLRTPSGDAPGPAVGMPLGPPAGESALATRSPTPTPAATFTATFQPSATHFPTRTITPTPLPVSTYTVQAGETLSAIAFRLGLSLTNLAGYNRIDDPSLIHAGQVLQVPPGGYTSPPLPTPSGPKQVVVSLQQQRVFAYQGDRQIYNFLVSTGKDNSTWTGSFTILDKLPYPYSTSWGFYMPYWLGIYRNPDNGNVENGFHALPITPAGDELWGSAQGTPVSYGCIVLTPYDAKILYDWVEIGTPVLIYP
jgi:LysM repeat protein